MRHRKKTVKLGRASAHRNMLLEGLVCSLIESKRITTTIVKAKAARTLAEKMVTLGKKGTLAARRNAMSKLRNPAAVKTLFDSIAPAFADRAGGYTRVVRVGRRGSDGSEMAILEWVEVIGESGSDKKGKEKKSKSAPVADKAKKSSAKKAKGKSKGSAKEESA